jgi:uncharacterized protein YjbI with pentapeptide repeats
MTKDQAREGLYELLRTGGVEEFNRQVAAGAKPSLQGADLSGLDLRGLQAAGLDLTDAYFRNADLRGIDFRTTTLMGTSFAGANISGCYFPDYLTAAEILLSLQHGTRVRYTPRG